MRVLILSGRPETISDYLKGAGHEVRECLSTDLAGRMAETYTPEVALFFVDVSEVPPVSRRDALKAMAPNYRVVLITSKTDLLVTYAAALGVKDFVFFPADPAAILYCLDNPAKPEDAAELLDRAEANIDSRGKEENTQKLIVPIFKSFLHKHQKSKKDSAECSKQVPKEPGIPKGRTRIAEPSKQAASQEQMRNAKIIEQTTAVPLFLCPRINTSSPTNPRDINQDNRLDFLTGLPRREAIAGMTLSHAHAVLFADLNGFKKVNDKFGHAVGDRLLQEFAGIAQRVVRRADTVVRWGGDEFVVLLNDSNRQNAEAAAERLRSQWVSSFLASRYKVGVAIGVSTAYDGVTLDEVVTAADAEMYLNKKKAAAPDPCLYIIYGAMMTDDLLKKVGKNGVLVDADIRMPLITCILDREAWKCDWRLGLRAMPVTLPFSVEFYGLTPELGNVLSDRDYEMFDDFLLALIAKKRVVVNVGKDERIDSGLSKLGAAVLKLK